MRKRRMATGKKKKITRKKIQYKIKNAGVITLLFRLRPVAEDDEWGGGKRRAAVL